MNVKKLLVAGVIASIASPGLASTQLERILNVPSGAFGLSEIVKLKNAREEGNRNFVRVIQGGKATFVRVH